MNIKTRVPTMLLSGLLTLSTVVTPALAAEYTVPGANSGPWGPITSVEEELEPADSASDYSKNTAYVPPGFGTPESYIPNRAEQLINLAGTTADDTYLSIGEGEVGWGNSVSLDANGFPSVDGSVTSGSFPTVDGGQSTTPPTFDNGSSNQTTGSGFTQVTSASYFSDGTLGTISIPNAGVNFAIREGTDSATMNKGAGHFVGTTIWDGNVCLAAHNRGVANNFGKIHLLKEGDKITLKTVYGTRTYEVYNVMKIHETDTACLADSQTNMITLTTCVANEKQYRYVVQGVAVN